MLLKKQTYWLIIYDIRDSKRLYYTEKCIANYGWRIQYSVFISNADIEVINKMQLRLKKIIKPEDSLLIFPICNKDWEKRLILGKKEENNCYENDFMCL